MKLCIRVDRIIEGEKKLHSLQVAFYLCIIVIQSKDLSAVLIMSFTFQ